MEQAYMGQGTMVDKGENARLNSIVGAIAIADLVKTTLGPKGLDKILQKVDPTDQSINVTNDGATILRSIPLDNAAAKVLVDIAKVQDDTIGDGTTSVAVLCGELLREAESLMDGASSSNSGSGATSGGNGSGGGGGATRIHPQTLSAGWRLAKQIAIQTLQDHSNALQDHFRKQQQPSEEPSSSSSSQLRSILMNIAKTTLSSKLVHFEKETFATLAVDAMLRLKKSNYDLHHIQIMKKPGGSLRDSYLEEGFLLNKSIGIGQPKRIRNAKIVLANTSMDTDKIKIYGSRVRVDSLTKVAAIEQAEKEKMKSKVDKILSHGNANVFINRQLIYNYPESIFAERGIMAIEHADFDGIERLAAVTGGQVLSTFDHPELVTLGECDIIEEIIIGEDKVIRFGGCKAGEACTIVLRGASTHILDEAERSIHDALCILSTVMKDTNTGTNTNLNQNQNLSSTTTINTDDEGETKKEQEQQQQEQESSSSSSLSSSVLFTPKIICGGGCTEILMAQAIDRYAETIPGKKALAMSAYAKALRSLPGIVADNGGYDSSELMTQLRAAHAKEQQQQQQQSQSSLSSSSSSYYGLNMNNGTIGNMIQLGILESYQSKLHVIQSASEAAEMIIRVDDIIKSAPRAREERY